MAPITCFSCQIYLDVDNMRSKGIGILVFLQPECPVTARVAPPSPGCSFHTKPIAQGLAAPASFPLIQQAIKRTPDIPLNVLRAASLEVLPWLWSQMQPERLLFLIRLLPPPSLFFDGVHFRRIQVFNPPPLPSESLSRLLATRSSS